MGVTVTIYVARRVLTGLFLLLAISFMFFVVTYVITSNQISVVVGPRIRYWAAIRRR